MKVKEMKGREKILFITILAIAELSLTLSIAAEAISSEWQLYLSTGLELTLISIVAKDLTKGNSSITSPITITLLFALIFSVCGKVVFTLRQSYGVGLGGAPESPIDFYRRFCEILYVFYSLAPKPKEILNTQIKNKNFKLKIFIFLTMAWLGASINTAWLTQVPLFSQNPDETRYLNRQLPLIAIGSLLLFMSNYAFSMLTIERARNKISKTLYLSTFILLYIPLTFTTSRLLMILPFICILAARYQEKKLSKNEFLKISSLAFFSLIFLMAFGAYRASGKINDITTALIFISMDTFPEFSGTVFTQKVIGDNYSTPLSTAIFGIFPDFFLSSIGISKKENFQLFGGILGELWNSNYSIRVSLIGELFFAKKAEATAFFVAFIFSLFAIHKKINNTSGIEQLTFIITGILFSLSIPYGASFLLLPAHFLIASIILFRIVR